ncbi:hypothetical protein GW17_00051663 [Ensete ventricosum]|nr:hypothetical protein GW17_00051663 [Ensete ventricosum]
MLCPYPATLFFLCQPHRRWLPMPPLAAMQPLTVVVPFLPRRAASHYDPTPASIATTISLFPFNHSEHRCLHNVVSLCHSDLSLPYHQRCSLLRCRRSLPLSLSLPTPSLETPLLPSFAFYVDTTTS